MYLFALFFVIYEFTTYSANDMIMPGMISIIHDFHAPVYFVALSMSIYILGNCIFILFASFFTERFGKRHVLITGNFLFLLFTTFIVFSTNIHTFMLLRFLQGIGLAIIAIGYALIHEKFNDKNAIKLIALMGNVAILAPMFGPVIGSVILTYFSWEKIFYVTATLSFITLIGLFFYTPKDTMQPRVNYNEMAKQYIGILTNREFLIGTCCLVFSLMTLLIWISQAPNIILVKLHLNYTYYVIYQLISIGGLTISSLVMQFIAGEFSMYRIVKTGALLILIGGVTSLLGSTSMLIITIGLFVYTFGMGLVNGCIIRLIMSIKGYSQSMLAAMLGFMETLLFFIAITLMNEYFIHFQFSLLSFTVSSFIFGVISFFLTSKYIAPHKERAWH